MSELTEKDKADIAKTEAEIKDLARQSRQEARRLNQEAKKLAIDEKRIYLDTIKALNDLLCSVTVDDFANAIGSELKFKRVLNDEEIVKCKSNIDYYLKKI